MLFFWQFSQNIDGIRQNNFTGILEFMNSILKQNPLIAAQSIVLVNFENENFL